MKISLKTFVAIIVSIAIICSIILFIFIKNVNFNKKSSSSNTQKLQSNNITHSFENSISEKETKYDNYDNADTSNSINWSNIFKNATNKVTVQFKKTNDNRIFKMDLPSDYEINSFQRDYEGQTIKDYIDRSKNEQKGIFARKNDTSFSVDLVTNQNHDNETATQRAQRKNPDGFSIGTATHPGWAFEDSGDVWVYYQGGDYYALSICYNNSTVLKKYGVKKIAEYLYSLVFYTE